MKRLFSISGKTLKVIFHAVCVLFTLFLVCLAVFLGRVYSEPLNVAELLPILEKYIIPENTDLKLEAKSVYLSASFERDGILFLDIQDMRLVRPDGRTALGLSDVEISYDFWSILTFDYMPDDLKIDGAFLRLVVDKNGQVSLSNEIKTGVLEPIEKEGLILRGEGGIGFRNLFKHLLSFNSFSLKNTKIIIDDQQKNQKISFPNLSIELERQWGFTHAVQIKTKFSIHDEKTNLFLEAQIHRLQKTISFALEFDRIRLKNLSRVIPVISDANLMVSGYIDGILDLSVVRKNPLDYLAKSSFHIKTKEGGTLNLPHPLTNLYHIETLKINGAVNQGVKDIKIAKSTVRLKNGPVANLQVDITGVDKFLKGEDASVVKTVLKSHISKLPIEQVPSVWPIETGPDAHRWVRENLSKGFVEQADFALYFKGDELIDLYGEVPVKNVQVRYLDEMTPVQKFSGLVKLYPDKLSITGYQGNVKGLGLKKAVVDLIDLQNETSYAKIKLFAEGPIQDALKLIDEKPLEFSKMFGLNPDLTKGQASVDVDLFFPLVDDLKAEQVQVNVQAQIKQATFPLPIENQFLTDGNFKLSVTNKKLVLNGMGIAFLSPVRLNWIENFMSQKSDDIQSQYDISMDVLTDRLKEKFPMVTDYLGGIIGVKGNIVKLHDNKLKGNFICNLQDSELKIKYINLFKERLTPATAAFSFENTSDKTLFNIEANGLTGRTEYNPFSFLVQGKIGLDNFISFEKVMTANTYFSGELSFKKDTFFNLSLQGEKFDFSGLMNKTEPMEDYLDKSEENQIDFLKSFPEIDVNINFDKVFFKKETPITQVKIILQKENDLWKDVLLNANSSVPVEVKFEDETQTLIGQTNDLGDLLSHLDITNEIIGGRVYLTGRQLKQGGWDGNLSIKQFSLKEPGFFIQAMTILGIIDAFRGQDLIFDKAEIPFKINSDINSELLISDGYMSGTSLGVTFNGQVMPTMLNLSGSVIPAYAINSLPGKIPLIGILFKDGEGGGLIGLKYNVSGTPSDPIVDFNPLQSIAPGILGRLFN